MGLSASCAAAATVGGFSLLSVLVYVADEHPTFDAGMGAQALQTGVVRLYSVVIMVVEVYPRCVHKSSLWAGLREMAVSAGPFLYPTP
jgi:hypothetical protein